MAVTKLSAPVSIRIPADIRGALDVLADKDNRTLSNYVVGVLRQHVANKRQRARLSDDGDGHAA